VVTDLLLQPVNSVDLFSLINRRRGEVPASAYKLLTLVVNNEENKLAVRKMLWKNTENLGLPLNDKLVNGFAYKTILSNPGVLVELKSIQVRIPYLFSDLRWCCPLSIWS
jgi:hypothetical protein